MKVDIQDVSSCKKTIKVEIPAEDVKKEFEKAYDEIRQNIEVPGFRKGRAPRNILKLRFGEYIKSEVFKNLVPSTVEEVINENKLKVLGTPDIHPPSDEKLFTISSEFKSDLDNNIISVELLQEFKSNKAALYDSATLAIEEKGRVWTISDDKNSYRIVADEDKLNVYSNEFAIDENNPLIFEVDVDVKPKIEIPDFSKFEVEKGDVNVTKEEVYEQLENLRREKANLISITDRPLQDGDLAKFSVKVFHNDEILRTEEESRVEINKEMVLPEFYDNIIGMNIGSEKEFSVSLPENYRDKELAGKEVKFHVVLKEIMEIQLPELDDEFAKDLGEEDLNHLTITIWNQLVEAKRHFQKRKQKEEISAQLIEKINFDVPERFINSFANDISKRMESSEEISYSDKTENDYKTIAERFIKIKWIIEEIAQQQKIEVSDNEIEQVVRNIALSKNKDPEKYMLQLKATDRLNAIVEEIKDNKVYEFLIEKASEKRGLII